MIITRGRDSDVNVMLKLIPTGMLVFTAWTYDFPYKTVDVLAYRV
jgi:hypothetical protein